MGKNKKDDNVMVVSIGVGSVPKSKIDKMKKKAQNYNKGGYANCGASVPGTQKKA